MNFSKRILSAIFAVAFVLSVVPMSTMSSLAVTLPSASSSAGVDDDESTGTMVDDGTGRIICPTVSVKPTAVLRVSAGAGTLTAGTTIITSVTPSGIPAISGDYTAQAYAGETPESPTVVFTTDKALSTTPSITCSNNSTVTFTGPAKNGNTYTFYVNGGTAAAGTYVDYEISYTYSYTDKLTNKAITKSYVAYGSSYVENIAQPAGYLVKRQRSATWTTHEAERNYHVERILGVNTYGSTYSANTTGYYYNFISGSNDTADSTTTDPTLYGMSNYTPSKASDGNVYAQTALDYNRPQSTSYVDTSMGTALNGVTNLRFAEKIIPRDSYTYTLLLASNVVLAGSQEFSSSSVNDTTSQNQIGFSASDAVVGDTTNAYYKTADSLVVPFTGTTYADAVTTQSNGNGKISYTLVITTQSYYSKSDRIDTTHMGYDFVINTYNKADLRGKIQECLAENIVTAPIAANSEKGVNPQAANYTSGWAEYIAAYKNAQEILAKPNTDQNTINAATTALSTAEGNLVVKEADYSAVTAAKAQVSSLTASNYTAQTWSALTTAVNAVVDGYSVFYQPAVDVMAANINTALNALVYAPADYTDVDDLITTANNVDKSLYTADSYQAVVDAVAAANTVTARSYNITQQALVDNLAKSIRSAIDALVYKSADYTTVNTLKAQFEALDESLYTTASYRLAKSAYDSVETGLDIRYQSDVDAMAEDLQDALDALKYQPASYTALNTAVSKANALTQSNYTTESWATLANALTSVQYNLDIRYQSTVDGYTTAINNAIAKLVERGGDYTGVEAAKLAAGKLTQSNYTDDSWTTLQTAINAVDYSLTITHQSTIDAYAANINTAIANLKEVTADYTTVNAYVAEYNADVATGYYTAASLLKVKTAVDAVDYSLTISKQSTVDGYASSIRTALDALVKKTANYTAVTTAVNSAKTYTTNEDTFAAANNNYKYYTETTYAALTTAVAGVVYNLDITHQTEVDAYAKAINDAIAGIQLNGADYSKVDAAIAKIPATINSGIYTTDSVAAVNTAKNNVDRTLKTDSQSTVNAYATAIDDAVAKLVYNKADYSSVDYVLTLVPSDLTIYTQDSVTALNTAIDAVVYDLDITHQSEVEDFANDINDAINALEVASADYTAVTNALAAIPSDLTVYTDATAADVNTAKNAVIYDLDITHQAEVTAMATAIDSAVKALVYKDADYTAVETAKTAYQAYTKENYTDASVKAVDDAIAAVVYGKNITEQATVDKYATDINTAIGKLTLKGADYTSVNEQLAKANALTASNYVDFTNVTAAVNAVVTGLDITHQSEVTAMATAIKTAIDGLKLKDADYTQVNSAMATADIREDMQTTFATENNGYSYYTPASYKSLTDALATVVTGLDITHQSEVTAMATAINNALTGLTLNTADYTTLDALVTSAKALNADDYTNYEDIYYGYIYPYYTTVSNNHAYKTDNQSKVNDMTATLQSYIDKLEKAPDAYFTAAEGSTTVIDNENMVISGIGTQLRSAAFIADYLAYSGVSVDVELSNGRFVGTDSTVTVTYADNTVKVYTVVVYGDINGDGNITSSDISAIQSAIVSGDTDQFTNAQSLAANVNEDRRINSTDTALIKRAVIGAITIDQVSPSTSK